MPSLDDLDRALISALRANGREPITALAKHLGVTRATVNARLKGLIDSGTILGFSVRVRADHDPDTVRAITLVEVGGRSTTQAIAQLRGLPEIVAIHTTNGAWDLVVELRTATLADFDRVMGQIRSLQGVTNSETSLLLRSVRL